MDRFHLAWISELLLIFGAVNLGIAWGTTGTTSPTPYITGLISVVISVILKYKAGIYK